MTSTPPV